MRNLTLVACLAVLGACGSSVGTAGPKVLDPPTMVIDGVSYDPVDGAGLIVTNKSCVLPIMGAASVSALAVGFSSYDGLCSFVKANTTCADKQYGKVASILIVRASSVAPGPIAPGTYTMGTTSDASGMTLASVAFDAMDATCNNVSAVAGATGSVTIAQVSPTVKGTINVTLLNGAGVSRGTYFGIFEASVCDYQADICLMMSDTGCDAGACLP